MLGALGDRALAAMRILDLTQYEAGTVSTQMLGWLGADVVKIESPVGGDPGRKLGSPLQNAKDDQTGADTHYFLIFNSNKRSVTLDLRKPRGRELFLEMVKAADVVVENLGPGTLERLKLDHAALSAVNPGIILARIKGFGLWGPYAEYKAFDPISQATGGAMSITGPRGGMPTRCGPSIADTPAGWLCALGILAAYVQRLSTGRGQVVEISMQETILNLVRGRYSDYYRTDPPKPAERLGNDLVSGAPGGMYPCKGGGPNDYAYVVTTPGGPGVWDALLRVIGREDLVGDPRYTTPDLRVERKTEVDGMFTDWSLRHTKQEVMELLGAAGVTCGAVLDFDDLLKDRHLVARGAIDEYDHPGRGRLKLPACPVRLSDSPATTVRPPLLGEHTDEVLSEALGLGLPELADLRAAGVI